MTTGRVGSFFCREIDSVVSMTSVLQLVSHNNYIAPPLSLIVHNITPTDVTNFRNRKFLTDINPHYKKKSGKRVDVDELSDDFEILFRFTSYFKNLD